MVSYNCKDHVNEGRPVLLFLPNFAIIHTIIVGRNGSIQYDRLRAGSNNAGWLVRQVYNCVLAGDRDRT